MGRGRGKDGRNQSVHVDMQKNGLKKEKKEAGHYEVMTKYLDFVQSIFFPHDFASKVVLVYFLEKPQKGTWTFDRKQA
jgi:hypothetical protein